jgi:hypothetical protein
MEIVTVQDDVVPAQQELVTIQKDVVIVLEDVQEDVAAVHENKVKVQGVALDNMYAPVCWRAGQAAEGTGGGHGRSWRCRTGVGRSSPRLADTS